MDSPSSPGGELSDGFLRAKGPGPDHEGYMAGFGNEFQSEALEGALPLGRNSPQRCPYGLYAEQLSGSPFTAPRHLNRRSWLYRLRPSVLHFGQMQPVELPLWRSAPTRGDAETPPLPLRWDPDPTPEEELTFVTGMRTLCAGGDVAHLIGSATHLYHVTCSMEDDYFYNADGELLVVPQLGSLRFCTELGLIDLSPGEIALLPRGMKFKVELRDGAARGFVCENYGARFTCPERGPIGANGLANPRDFLTPLAAYERKEKPCRLFVKWQGAFHVTEIGQSPLDVVAWHGNYVPCKYDLRRFSPVGPLLFDHADPSIFTVLISPTDTPGMANVDFVIFPPRWMVAEDTFRPPWFHMNVMSEFMGLIEGVYDAKPEGFLPGGYSLHNGLLPHGPDAEAFYKASFEALEPRKLDNTLAFMFETRLPQHLTAYAAKLPTLQKTYPDVWRGLKCHFDPERREWDG